MKKYIKTILVMSTICITNAHAQEIKLNAINKAKHASYMVTQSTDRSLDIHNNENVHQDVTPRQPSDLKVEKDKHSVLTTFRQVFSVQRLQQLSAEPMIWVRYLVSPSTGKILEISFILKKNTLITVTELESLENALKANVVFKFRKEEVKNNEFIRLNESVPFRRVLDGTLPEDWDN